MIENILHGGADLIYVQIRPEVIIISREIGAISSQKKSFIKLSKSIEYKFSAIRMKLQIEVICVAFTPFRV
jgi:hypothetical protein